MHQYFFYVRLRTSTPTYFSVTSRWRHDDVIERGQTHSLIRRQERLKSFQLMFVLKSLLRPNLWQQSSNRLQLHFVLMQPNHPNCDPKKTSCDWLIHKLSSWFLFGCLTLKRKSISFWMHVKMGQFWSYTVSHTTLRVRIYSKGGATLEYLI